MYSLLNGGESCVICGAHTYFLPVCKKCAACEFQILTHVNRCSCCGKVLISTKGTCFECRENPVLINTDFVFPLFSYRLWNKELLFLWKIKNIRALSYFFASKISIALKQKGIKVIVPVPPRKGKIAEKGWDQIDELCSILKYFFGFQVLIVLERISEKQQKKLDRAERLSTIQSAYKMLPQSKIKRNLKEFNGCLPEKVCIIDDVCTTGSTLECCARLLKEYGFKKVGALCLFTVD